MELQKRLSNIDWQSTAQKLSQDGFALIPDILTRKQCGDLKQSWYDEFLFRKTVDMQRYRLGQGDYKYLDYPLPEIVSQLRCNLYEKLTPVVNDWQQQLADNYRYPASYSDFIHHCRENQQALPSCLILRYEQEGFNRMHQDLYGDVFFPIQAAILLSEPEQDFTGGEMIFSEHSPRIQTQATVLNPNRGGMVIFTTNYRPIKGKYGFRKTNVRHGVSKVRSGERFCLGIPFHDAKT